MFFLKKLLVLQTRKLELTFAVCFRELEPATTTCKLDADCSLYDHFILSSKPFIISKGIFLP